MKYQVIFFDKPLVLLDQFAEYAKEERVERLPYKIWRELKTMFLDADTLDCQVGFKLDDMNNILIGLSKRDIGNFDPLIYEHVDINDESFGTFIYNFLAGIDSPWKETGPIFYPKSEKTLTVKLPNGDWASTTVGCVGEIAVCPKGQLYVNDGSNWNAVSCSPKSNNVVIDGDLIVKGKIINDTNTERESNNMKFNFDFGTCENDNVRVSPYGIAIKNAAGTWVSYDAKTGNIIDVDIFNFNGGKYLFKMPVAVKDVKAGDIVIHNRVACFVKGVTDGTVIAIDPYAGEEKSILFTKTPFGFDFVTKVVCLFDGAFNGASNDNPFGNMLPFFLMSNDNGKKGDIDPLMMAMLLNGNAPGGLQNPMMLALLCGDQTNMRDVLPLMMLAGQANPFTGAAK